MRPKTLTTNGVSVSSTYPVDWRADPFNIGIQIDVTGAVTATMQFTMSRILEGEAAVWIDFPAGIFVGLTTDVAGSFTTPCTAIRLNHTVGAGSTSIRIIQSSGVS
jgi:hypothetical protein